jgi:hypothetical protein
MRILIQTPLNQREAIPSSRLMAKLNELDDVYAFSMPGFLDYVLTTKKMGSFEEAFFRSITSVENVEETFKELFELEHLIVIGTAPKDLKFDIVFSFNSDNEMVGKHDYDIDMFLEKYKDNKNVVELLSNLYTEEDSESYLIDEDAIVGFVKDLIEYGFNKNKA